MVWISNIANFMNNNNSNSTWWIIYRNRKTLHLVPLSCKCVTVSHTVGFGATVGCRCFLSVEAPTNNHRLARQTKAQVWKSIYPVQSVSSDWWVQPVEDDHVQCRLLVLGSLPEVQPSWCCSVTLMGHLYQRLVFCAFKWLTRLRWRIIKCMNIWTNKNYGFSEHFYLTQNAEKAAKCIFLLLSCQK